MLAQASLIQLYNTAQSTPTINLSPVTNKYVSKTLRYLPILTIYYAVSGVWSLFKNKETKNYTSLSIDSLVKQ